MRSVIAPSQGNAAVRERPDQGLGTHGSVVKDYQRDSFTVLMDIAGKLEIEWRYDCNTNAPLQRRVEALAKAQCTDSCYITSINCVILY